MAEAETDFTKSRGLIELVPSTAEWDHVESFLDLLVVSFLLPQLACLANPPNHSMPSKHSKRSPQTKALLCTMAYLHWRRFLMHGTIVLTKQNMLPSLGYSPSLSRQGMQRLLNITIRHLYHMRSFSA